MPEVFDNDRDVVCVGERWIRDLKNAAAASPRRRARLRLHHENSDAVQEMIIALCRDLLFAPHRHARKTESFHLIEGELYVLVFEDDGSVRHAIHMGPPGSGRQYCYRLCEPAWHAILPKTDFVVFHETTAGPFQQDTASQFAPWAPKALAPLRAFLESSLEQGLRSDRRLTEERPA